MKKFLPLINKFSQPMDLLHYYVLMREKLQTYNEENTALSSDGAQTPTPSKTKSLDIYENSSIPLFSYQASQ